MEKKSSNISNLLKTIRNNKVRIIDLRFTDLFGQWQHFSVSAKEFSEAAFTDGLGFDGSSIRGFQHIHESDMVLFPDATSAFMDPFTQESTLVMICDI